MGQCKVVRSLVIEAEIDRVWLSLRNFDQIPWDPSVIQCRLISGWDAPAAVREVLTSNGRLLIEQLTGLDDIEHKIAFRSLAPGPHLLDKRTEIIMRETVRPNNTEVQIIIWYETDKNNITADNDSAIILELDNMLLAMKLYYNNNSDRV